jgi:hypothetical protein
VSVEIEGPLSQSMDPGLVGVPRTCVRWVTSDS